MIDFKIVTILCINKYILFCVAKRVFLDHQADVLNYRLFFVQPVKSCSRILGESGLAAFVFAESDIFPTIKKGQDPCFIVYHNMTNRIVIFFGIIKYQMRLVCYGKLFGRQ